ncbi:MAG: hypothetical protein AAF787_01430 [Chloroflexota bacterium]
MTPEHKMLPFRALCAATLTVQLLSIPALWGHQSTPADILGRYSVRYAPALALNVLLIAASVVLVVIAPRVRGWLAVRSGWLVYGVLVVGLLAVAGVGFSGVEAQLLAYLCLNGLAGVILVLHTRSLPLLHPMVRRNLVVGLAVLMLLAMIPVAITGLGINQYEPDEGHYADIATTYFADGGVYYKSWGAPFYVIRPGLGWFYVVYGIVLETFGYSVYISRVLNLLIYGLFLWGAYRVAAQLYGRGTALTVLGVAAVGLVLLPDWEYRPAKFVLPVGVWAFDLALRAHRGSGWRYSAMHTGVGLLVTLALQLHAVCIVAALTFSLYYALRTLWRLWYERTLSVIYPALAFGAGALAGSVIYMVANVLPAGGFDVFLNALAQTSETPRPQGFAITRYESLYEQVLLALAIVFLLWRRAEPDRTLLAVLALTVFSAYALDTQGYIWHVAGVYPLVVGMMLAGMYGEDTAKRLIVSGGAVGLLALQLVGGHTNWNTVRYTLQNGELPPFLYHELKTVLPQYVTPDDVVYSTHQLIWVFPHTGDVEVISYGGEIYAMRRDEINSRRALWDSVQPTVIIFIENHMIYDEGMQQYMADHPFELCDTLTVLETDIEILRPDCETIEEPVSR